MSSDDMTKIDYPMRRKDRLMDESYGLYIIDKAEYAVGSLKDQDQIYSIPLSIARDGDFLYFHSGPSGRKVDLLEDDAEISLVFVADVKVPDLYSDDEMDLVLRDDDLARKNISSIFTTEFGSCIVNGRVKRLEDKNEKIHGLRLICQKYTPSKMAYFDKAIQISLDRTLVYKVLIQEISSKRKKYDSQGKELKFMRYE